MLCAQCYSDIVGKNKRFKRLSAHFRGWHAVGFPFTSQLENNGSEFLPGVLGGGSVMEVPGATLILSGRWWSSSLEVRRQHLPDSSLFFSLVTLRNTWASQIITGQIAIILRFRLIWRKHVTPYTWIKIKWTMCVIFNLYSSVSLHALFLKVIHPDSYTESSSHICLFSTPATLRTFAFPLASNSLGGQDILSQILRQK